MGGRSPASSWMAFRSPRILTAATLLGVGTAAVAATTGTRDRPAAVAQLGGDTRPMSPLPVTAKLRDRSVGPLLAEPDGSIRFAARGLTIDEDGDVQDTEDFGITSVTTSGRATHVLRFPTTTEEQQVAEPVVGLSAFGSTVAEVRYPIRDGRSVGSGVVHVVSRDARGTVLADDALGLLDGGFVGDVVTGPTGAVAVTGIRDPTDRSVPYQPGWLVLKPSGAKHVGAPMALDDGSDQTVSDVLLGPDGGGVVISRSPRSAPSLRRLSATGALGPPRTIGSAATRFDHVVGSFAPDGTLHLMLSGDAEGALSAATLPPGASAPTPPRRVPGGTGGVVVEPRSMAFTPDGGIIVAASRPGRGFKVFEGRGAALRQTASVWAATRPPTIVVDRRGTTSLLWEDGVRGLPDDTRIVAMRRPAGGSFGRAVQISAPGLPPLTLDDAVPTVDGNVAVAFHRLDPNRSYVVPRVWP